MYLPVKSNPNSEEQPTTTSSTQTPIDLSPCAIGEGDFLPQAHYQNPNHCVLSFAAINRMRQNVQLCDVTLQAADTEELFHCHKIILASVSVVFNRMFASDMKEKSDKEIQLKEVDASSLKQLIEYCYTGEITITEDNVQALLQASNLLQIQPVRENCSKFLMEQLHPSNALGIKAFAELHSCEELYIRSYKYVLRHFQEVISTEEFLLLNFENLRDLISNNELNISSEEDLFMAVLHWIKHDLDERKVFVPELMAHVRLPLVNREFLMNCEADPIFREDPKCNLLLLEAMKYHLLPEHRSQLKSQRTLERQPSGTKTYVFSVGGGSLFAIHNECEAYNPKTNLWFSIAPMQVRRSRAGAASLRKSLYVVGGYDGENDLSSAEFYNPLLNEWKLITPMGSKRSCLGICAFDGLLYVCGGYDGASCLASVERYDPLTGIWSSSPAMITRRRYCRVAKLDNCIYALGGFDSSTYQSSVERFDPRVGIWQSVPSMTSRRSSCGVAALDGELYCIGGSDGTMCLLSGEKYNLRTCSWENIAPMHTRRSTHEVVEVNGMLYALGGNDGSSSLNSCEKYDPKTNKWSIVTSMLTRRSSIGASVLECFNLEKKVVQTLK